MVYGWNIFYPEAAIHATYNDNKSVPCCYAFITSKLQSLYEAFLQRVADTCQNIKITEDHHSSDFETDLLPATLSIQR